MRTLAFQPHTNPHVSTRPVVKFPAVNTSERRAGRKGSDYPE